MSDQAFPTTAIATWVTREEFMLIHAVQYVAWVMPAYGAQELGPEQRDEYFSSWGRGLRFGIRFLDRFGFKFKGIKVDERGELRPTQVEPVEPRNEMFLMKRMGERMISPVLAIRTALKLLDEQELVEFDRGPLKEVLIQCEKDRDAAIAWWEEDQETAKAAEDFYRERMEKIGFKPLPEGDIN